MCQDCRIKHNRQTKTLKQKYKKESLCVDCGALTSAGTRCLHCIELHREQNIKSISIKYSKTGKFNKLEELEELI